ncbi:MAG: sensor histidine kinase [Roseburia sp.]|nr:sensor histidine kinase [Roseburia sp.]MCM1277715.1 sensor histidine kinase [Robinsoniella sp.]
MMDYIKERRAVLFWQAGFLAFINVYFGYICGTNVYVMDLLYFDLLCLLAAGFWAKNDYDKWKRLGKVIEGEELEAERERKELMGNQLFAFFERSWQKKEEEIAALQDEIREQTDYMTKWVHETKLPLSALKLMNERNPDSKLKEEMQEQLERLGQLLNRIVMNGKLSSPQYDTKFEKLMLKDVVKESMKNYSYFLIKEHFRIEMELKGLFVYSDRRWLVYLLDQLIGNSIKYKKEEPALLFGGKKLSQEETLFWIEDKGIGIDREEIPYIFDKGYVGSNLRKGDYRSTGMGLYFVKKIASFLNIDLRVESKRGEGTRFELYFHGNTDYFLMD